MNAPIPAWIALVACLCGFVLWLALSYAYLRLSRRVSQQEGIPAQALGQLDRLESVQVARELEWRETKEQLARHLRRVAAVEQRASQRAARQEPEAEGDEDDEGDEIDQVVELIRAKYRR